MTFLLLKLGPEVTAAIVHGVVSTELIRPESLTVLPNSYQFLHPKTTNPFRAKYSPITNTAEVLILATMKHPRKPVRFSKPQPTSGSQRRRSDRSECGCFEAPKPYININSKGSIPVFESLFAMAVFRSKMISRGGGKR